MLKHSACILLLAIRPIALPVFTAIVDVSVCWHQKGEARSTGPSVATLALPGRSRRIEIGVFRHRYRRTGVAASLKAPLAAPCVAGALQITVLGNVDAYANI
jgi:hypothetical protein